MNEVSNSENKSSGAVVVWRTKGKTVQIGEDIFVTVLSTNDISGARLRVQAPRNVNIKRIDQIE